MAKARDYKHEYATQQASPAQIAARSSRNKARREVTSNTGKPIGRGMEVDHKDGNPRNNKPSNLQVVTRHKNRVKGDPQGNGR